MRIASLNTGHARTLRVGGREIQTGIFKQPTPEALEVNALGFATDTQVNKRFHGGPDKALCAYPSEHFLHWANLLGREFVVGSFGENLSLHGLLETQVHVGDVFKVGTATLEVTQPRQPCATLAARHQQPNFVKLVAQAGFTGWYFRVLKPGVLQVEDRLERLHRGQVSIHDAMMTMLEAKTKPDLPAIRHLHAQAALSQAWRESLDAILGPEAP